MELKDGVSSKVGLREEFRPGVGSSPCQTVDKRAGRIRAMFAEISPRYDLLNHLLSCGQDIIWRRRAARVLKGLGTGPVLDVCCGTGDLILEFCRRVGNRHPMIGVDFCRPMLQLAARKAARRGVSILLVEGDGLALPFPDDQFAVVAVAFGLRNMADPRMGLAEMRRVCRPGGEVAILEFTLPQGPLLGRLYKIYFRHVLPRVGQWLAPNKHSAYEYLPASVFEFPKGAGLVREMDAVGLREVRAYPFTFGIATLYTGRK